VRPSTQRTQEGIDETRFRRLAGRSIVSCAATGQGCRRRSRCTRCCPNRCWSDPRLTPFPGAVGCEQEPGFRAVPRGDLHRFAVMAAIGGLGHVGGSDIELQTVQISPKAPRVGSAGQSGQSTPRSVRPTFPVGWAPWGAGARAGRRG
jgi:hypothetical protein